MYSFYALSVCRHESKAKIMNPFQRVAMCVVAWGIGKSQFICCAHFFYLKENFENIFSDVVGSFVLGKNRLKN